MSKVITTSASATQTAPALPPKVLTVIVVDSKSQRASGANVSLSPSGQSGVTNNNGEVQFKLGTATKYDVTVKLQGNTITVPYYVTAGGATNLMVNPSYVKAVEAARSGSNNESSYPILYIGGGIGIILIIIVLWRLFRKRSKK